MTGREKKGTVPHRQHQIGAVRATLSERKRVQRPTGGNMRWIIIALTDATKHFLSSALAGLLAYSSISITASRYYCAINGLPYRTLLPEQVDRCISRLSWSAALLASITVHCWLDR
jgi:hypothetical protein